MVVAERHPVQDEVRLPERQLDGLVEILLPFEVPNLPVPGIKRTDIDSMKYQICDLRRLILG